MSTKNSFIGQKFKKSPLAGVELHQSLQSTNNITWVTLPELEPRLAEVRAGKHRVLFMDAAHLVLGADLSMVWCFERLFIASPSGQQRFNVLGAVDAVTKEIFTITHEAYINVESLCPLLSKIAARMLVLQILFQV